MPGVGYEQSDQKVSSGAAECDFPDHRERGKTDSAARASAEDKSGRAGYRERSQRFVVNVLDDIAIAAVGASWSVGTHRFNAGQETRLTICATT
ncbi:MAG: hypothetical protein QOK03_2880 [Candidatus Binataceae bacterium]|nr:hypothetical protein [Candidatus Binataceae bacterium]